LKTILVADDETVIVYVLTALLADEGYDVITAENGRDALQLVEKRYVENQQVDLVLSDVMMPIMDGVELCQAIDAHPVYQAIPVILMSAGFDVIDRKECNYSAFLNKPFEFDTVLKIINKIFEAKK
jgi:CheY-like chemotaxis protein